MERNKELPGNPIHGGRGAIKRISQGKELVGLGAEAQSQVQARVADHGIDGELRRNAERWQAATDLYYNALMAALQSGDVERATGLLAKWGWGTNSAIRAWTAVKQTEKTKDYTGKIIDSLSNYRSDADKPQGAKNGTNN
mgnify:FL=1